MPEPVLFVSLRVQKARLKTKCKVSVLCMLYNPCGNDQLVAMDVSSVSFY